MNYTESVERMRSLKLHGLASALEGFLEQDLLPVIERVFTCRSFCRILPVYGKGICKT